MAIKQICDTESCKLRARDLKICTHVFRLESDDTKFKAISLPWTLAFCRHAGIHVRKSKISVVFSF